MSIAAAEWEEIMKINDFSLNFDEDEVDEDDWEEDEDGDPIDPYEKAWDHFDDVSVSLSGDSENSYRAYHGIYNDVVAFRNVNFEGRKEFCEILLNYFNESFKSSLVCDEESIFSCVSPDIVNKHIDALEIVDISKIEAVHSSGIENEHGSFIEMDTNTFIKVVSDFITFLKSSRDKGILIYQ